jgi:hypothetical protein
MKRATEEVLNDHQSVKKLKVDSDNIHGSDANMKGWSKVEKKKKKQAKAGTGKQYVSCSGQGFGFITQLVHHDFEPIRPVCFDIGPPSWRP